jgi:hypothetical protein
MAVPFPLKLEPLAARWHRLVSLIRADQAVDSDDSLTLPMHLSRQLRRSGNCGIAFDGWVVLSVCPVPINPERVSP